MKMQLYSTVNGITWCLSPWRSPERDVRVRVNADRQRSLERVTDALRGRGPLGGGRDRGRAAGALRSDVQNPRWLTV